ncbi:DUF4962 domain-containing protein [uncultured Alistipes sp.]|uniref:DUF4962 domain-containing protein n=1 Tax=uncultured Alistipes sp. TaxID=538949 RepID=UPI0032B259BF
MKRLLFLTALALGLVSGLRAQQPATLRPDAETLMHEMRATPSPLDGETVADRKVSFQWPLPEAMSTRETGLDGPLNAAKQPKVDKRTLRYRLRWSPDAEFRSGVTEVETRYPFYNPDRDLKPGVWYWQYGYVEKEGVKWSPVLRLTVEENPAKFCPPALKDFLPRFARMRHPRVLIDGREWDRLIEETKGLADRKVYIHRADKALATPMKTLDDINTKLVEGLKNEMQRNAMLTRESRRIVDQEEANTDVLIRAYLLTRDRRYADEALHRVKVMAGWDGSDKLSGDFNDATLLSLCSQAYDAFYDLLSRQDRALLLEKVRIMGTKFYDRYNNHLENHIADNHVWQMTLRILTMAAFSVCGDLPEADVWADYCYNIWLARFPGLNQDGAWHNGDSYFAVNFRTLIEVPYLYSRISGFDFFSDPWYRGNARYVIYQQPPFSKSGGNGSSHQKILAPNGTRVSYADALARLTGDTFAADYVRTIQSRQPDILQQGCTGKAGGLAWFRLQCRRPLPEGDGLEALPLGQVFPQSGLASFSTALADTDRSAMLSFRSSPYGSTSHAVANQNAFNTFFGGQSLFYSSGHHIAFVDHHSILCHRASRAHNTILVNGLNQRIGTEGYGWIPRHYVGEKIGYVVGDASNAYGKVISTLWLDRAAAAELEYSRENGWDDTPLTLFRRHVIELGTSGYTVIYDELEASEPAEWDYLLHAVRNPIDFGPAGDGALRIRTTNDFGASDAFLYGAGPLQAETTDRFFRPAVNWLRADADGKFESYPDHWHFTARSDRQARYRFLTIVHTHAGTEPTAAPEVLSDGSIRIAGWHIEANRTTEGAAAFRITGTQADNVDVEIGYTAGEPTLIREKGGEVLLTDRLPQLEI